MAFYPLILPGPYPLHILPYARRWERTNGPDKEAPAEALSLTNSMAHKIGRSVEYNVRDYFEITIHALRVIARQYEVQIDMLSHELHNDQVIAHFKPMEDSYAQFIQDPACPYLSYRLGDYGFRLPANTINARRSGVSIAKRAAAESRGEEYIEPETLNHFPTDDPEDLEYIQQQVEIEEGLRPRPRHTLSPDISSEAIQSHIRELDCRARPADLPSWIRQRLERARSAAEARAILQEYERLHGEKVSAWNERQADHWEEQFGKLPQD